MTDYEAHPELWFDQFPDPPADWTHDQWCWRHWAPAPVFGANGILASITVLSAVVELMPADATPEGRNRWMADAGKLCCTLGDKRMYDIWGKCPPSGGAQALAPGTGGIGAS